MIPIAFRSGEQSRDLERRNSVLARLGQAFHLLVASCSYRLGQVAGPTKVPNASGLVARMMGLLDCSLVSGLAAVRHSTAVRFRSQCLAQGNRSSAAGRCCSGPVGTGLTLRIAPGSVDHRC